MELSVRAYIFDEQDRVLLVKHDATQPRVLPWGHVEEGETFYSWLAREIEEELWCRITLVGAENEVSTDDVKPMPLPVSIHRVRYEHRERGPVEKLELFFFARLKGWVEDVRTEEIYEWEWFETDDILDMQNDKEIYAYIQEILEQNIDLLELVG